MSVHFGEQRLYLGKLCIDSWKADVCDCEGEVCIPEDDVWGSVGDSTDGVSIYTLQYQHLNLRWQ